MKKLLLALIAIGLLGLLAYGQRSAIATRILERGLDSRLGADTIATLDDGLHLALCGAGGPLPAPTASGPCVAVVAGRQLFVVDAGTDGVRNLGRMGYPAGAIRAVFLTHFHSDHIDGLGELATLRWVSSGSRAPLPVYGPPGVERVVAGFNTAYAQDMAYRHAHHGDTVAALGGAGMTALPFAEPAPGVLTTVHDSDGLTVQTFAVDHAPATPAVGYLFRYGGRSLLISGDTAHSDDIGRFAQGVDLLVHEALAPNLVAMMHAAAQRLGNSVLAKVTADIPDYHTSPLQAATLARDAGVGHLLYYHIVPPLLPVPGMRALFLDGADAVFADYTVGEDGVSFSLPANSTKIIRTRDGL